MDRLKNLGVIRQDEQEGDFAGNGIHWKTLEKILEHPEPLGYGMKEERPKPKIGPYLERIGDIFESDRELPKKQRHTAKRIYERIREEGY